LQNDNELLGELTTRQWVMDSKGRRGVESKPTFKKRDNRSPDKADATILCFYSIGAQSFPDQGDEAETPSAPLTSGLMGTSF
jgi:phage terminase large subunit